MIAVKHAAHRGVRDRLRADAAMADQKLPGLHANHDLLQIEVRHFLEPLVED